MHLSYYDHPPFVSYLFKLGSIFDFGNASRLPGVILNHCGILFWIYILKDRLKPSQFKYFYYLLLFSPMLGFAAIVITPDVPLFFFWSFSLYCFFNILERSRALDYLLLGIALGLGGLSKYNILFFLICGTVYLLFEKKWKSIKWKYVPISILVGALFCSPVFIWNSQNNWDSFLFQIRHGLGADKWEWQWTVEYLVSQILLFLPITLFYALKAKPKNNLKVFIYFAWIPLVLFFFSSFKGRVEANWTLVAYPSILVLAVLGNPSFKWIKYYIGFWLIVLGIIFVEINHHFIPYPEEKLKTYELKKFDELIPYVKKYQPIYAYSFQMAASLHYKTGIPIYKMAGLSRRDHYDYIKAAKPDSDIFYVLVSTRYIVPYQFNDYEVKKIDISPRFYMLKVNRNATPNIDI